MKIYFLIALIIGLSACATPITYSHQEQCALNGMVLSGVDLGGGETVSRIENKLVVSSSDWQSVRCSIPSNDNESKYVSGLQKQLVPKVEYNSDIRAKRLITGFGYFLWVAPGIYAKYYYDQEKELAIQESIRLAPTPLRSSASDNP